MEIEPGCYTDTDSYIYQIRTKDLFRDLKYGSQYFDFSTYPKTHPLFNSAHRKEPGKMKDESGGAILCEFVGLRSKMYSLKYAPEHSQRDTRKAKGLGQVAVTKMQHADYLSCLMETKQMTHAFHAIRSTHHQICTIRQTKLSLSPYDDKRFLLSCGNHSPPYGHKRLLKRAYAFDRCQECCSSKKKRYNIMVG